MNGFMQTCFYFGYMGLLFWGLFLLLGNVGFRCGRGGGGGAQHAARGTRPASTSSSSGLCWGS